jgi:hypothetical protein
MARLRKKEEKKGHTSPNRDYKLQPHPIISPYQTRHLPLSSNGERGRRINMLDHYYQFLSSSSSSSSASHPGLYDRGHGRGKDVLLPSSALIFNSIQELRYRIDSHAQSL